MSHDERRRTPRAPLRTLVQFRLYDVDQFKREHATSLSETGMFLRSTEPLEVGTVLFVSFSLMHGKPLIQGLAKVVRVVAPPDEHAGMGVAFVELDEASRAFIARVVGEGSRQTEGTTGRS